MWWSESTWCTKVYACLDCIFNWINGSKRDCFIQSTPPTSVALFWALFCLIHCGVATVHTPNARTMVYRHRHLSTTDCSRFGFDRCHSCETGGVTPSTVSRTSRAFAQSVLQPSNDWISYRRSKHKHGALFAGEGRQQVLCDHATPLMNRMEKIEGKAQYGGGGACALSGVENKQETNTSAHARTQGCRALTKPLNHR